VFVRPLVIPGKSLQSSLKVVEERHYQLVPADDLDQQAIRNYRP
jgi:hypothetical protein